MWDFVTEYFTLVSRYRRNPSSLGLSVTSNALVALRDRLPMQCRLRSEVNNFLSQNARESQAVSS